MNLKENSTLTYIKKRNKVSKKKCWVFDSPHHFKKNFQTSPVSIANNQTKQKNTVIKEKPTIYSIGYGNVNQAKGVLRKKMEKEIRNLQKIQRIKL